MGHVGKAGSESAADEKPGKTYEEGDHAYNRSRCKGCQNFVAGYGEAYGQGVYRSGDALKYEEGKAYRLDFCFLRLTFTFYTLPNHISTDKCEKYEGNPRDQILEEGEIVGGRLDAEPAYHGHEKLEYCENAGDEAHASALHTGLVQAVGKGHRKCVHGKAHA